jgi:hypothetical protein
MNTSEIIKLLSFVRRFTKQNADLASKKFGHVLARLVSNLLSIIDFIMTALKPFSWRSGATDNLSHLIEDPILSEEDADLIGLQSPQHHEKYLNTYTHDDIKKAMQNFGITERLQARGYHDLKIKTDTTDPFVHHLVVSDTKLDNFPGDSNFVISLFTRRRDYTIREFTFYSDKNISLHKFLQTNLPFSMKLTVVEWVCMQDPLLGFHQDVPHDHSPHLSQYYTKSGKYKKQLPGQKYPGLGVGYEFHKMLITLAEEAGRDGLMDVPEHFHNAVMYHEGGFHFVSPQHEAFFLRVFDHLKPEIASHSLASVSWAFHLEFVKDENGDVIKWKPEEQICPTSLRMKKYFGSSEYNEYIRYKAGGMPTRVWIDWQQAHERFAAIL